MKKRRLFKIAALLALLMHPSLLTAAGPGTGSTSYTATYSTQNLTIGTDTLGGVTYSTVTYSDLYNSGEPGMPSLPVDYLKFSVPYNATNFIVTATVRSWSNQYLDHLLYPCQRPMFTDGSDSLTITLPDSSAYYSGEYYPSQVAWVADEGFLAGENHVVTVAMVPFRYSHTGTSDFLRTVTRCNLTLRYEISDSLAMQPIIRNDSTLREEGYDLTQTMVINPLAVRDNAPRHIYAGIDSTIFIHGFTGDQVNGGIRPPGTPDPNPVDPGDIGEGELTMDLPYPYLIVTTPELKHAVRRIVAIKRQKGYNVKVVTMDDVMHDSIAQNGDFVNGHYAYTDSAGALRQYLRKHYADYGTQYVLLVGSDIPYKTISDYTYVLDKDTITTTIQSDLYYSDLSADWSIQNYDKNPELYVGRILAKNQNQISNYIDKLYRYEINPGRGDFNYLKRCFYSQGYDMSQNNEVLILESFLDPIFPNPRVLQEPESIIDGIPVPSGEDIVSELNSTPYSFISLHHHGCPSSLITCGNRSGKIIPPISFLWSLDNELVPSFAWHKNDTLPEYGLNNIANKYFPSICFSISCETMPFDIPPYYKTRGLTMSFGESFTTGKDYGGPLFIGNTAEGLTPYSMNLEVEFAKQIIRGNYKMGMANSLGKTKINNSAISYYIALTENLLGDPSLELWTDLPQRYENITMTRSDNSIIINGINGIPTIISVMDANGVVKKGEVTGDLTLNNISPNCAVTLFNHNRIPFFAPLYLQNITLKQSQYVIAHDVIAGNSVDGNRTCGDVKINNGVEFEIETSGTVTLEYGFKVEKGATFAIYPACF